MSTDRQDSAAGTETPRVTGITTPPPAAPATSPQNSTLGWMLVVALGMVFGDIGTSPLYTWNEIILLSHVQGDGPILGATSVIFWTLTLAITIKYVVVLLRADNHGEGGTFALLGLLQGKGGRAVAAVSGVLVVAACLLYADGVLMPAVSVLSAVEGLRVASPYLSSLVVPISLVVISALFAAARFGSNLVGRAFGPMMLVWFAVLAALGAYQIALNPEILWAVSPHHAGLFLLTNPPHQTAMVLGAVVLAITGGEALYADLGRLGPKPIRIAWSCIVYPALILNYLGQGAFLHAEGVVREHNVFYSTVPSFAVIPMVILATMAAGIASQSLITGAFTLTRSAINLGLLPRTRAVHMSSEDESEVYLPTVTTLLWAGCCALVLYFQSSSELAAAYGLAVTAVMVSTSVGVYLVATRVWGWSWWYAMPLFGAFLAMDLLYLGESSLKLLDGGYVPIAIAAGLYAVMYSWRTGRRMLAEAYRRVERISVAELLDRKGVWTEIPRAMVFMSSDRILREEDKVPVVLTNFLKRYGGIPKFIVLFSVVYEGAVPYWKKERFEATDFGEYVTSVRMHIGYREQANVRDALKTLKARGQILLREDHWSIVMGSEHLLIGPGPFWWRWKFALFEVLMRTSTQAHVYFGLQKDLGVIREEIPVRVERFSGMEVKAPTR